MRGITLKSFFYFSAKEFGGCHSEFLTFFTVDSKQFFCRIIIVLDFFFGAHRDNQLYCKSIDSMLACRSAVLKLALSRYSFTQLSQIMFLELAHLKMDELTQVAQSYDDSFDVQATSSILKIARNNHSIVINTQTPNRQLWYSSTLSGPQRYNYSESGWVSAGNEREITDTLRTDMGKMI